MDQSLEDIKNMQKASWDTFSPGWKKWDILTMQWLRSHGDFIIEALAFSETDYVLDIAAGTGEPGVSIAPLLKHGSIVITDLSDGMLSVAKEKVDRLGLTNAEIQTADACDLPFEDNSFDKISCRLGLMFVPDMQLAINEIYRVLKPGGKFATTVWGAPEKNFWGPCMMGNIKRHVDVPDPKPGATGVFRCAEKGMVSDLLSNAGFEQVNEKPIPGIMATENGEHYWEYMTSIAAPFVAILSETDDETVELIHQGVVRDMDERYPNGGIESEGILIQGVKPE